MRYIKEHYYESNTANMIYNIDNNLFRNNGLTMHTCLYKV